MLRLIKSRKETKSFNPSLGLFNVNIFQSDQDYAHHSLEKNTLSNKSEILYILLYQVLPMT